MKASSIAVLSLVSLLAIGCSGSEVIDAGASATPTPSGSGPDTELSAGEVVIARQVAETAQAEVTGTFIGATAVASAEPDPLLENDTCPDARVIRVRLVWKADANFTHSGLPGGPPDGPRKASLLTIDAATGRVCAAGAMYRNVGPDDNETLLYGTRP